MMATLCIPFRFCSYRSGLRGLGFLAALFALSFACMAQEANPASGTETSQTADAKAVPTDTAPAANAKTADEKAVPASDSKQQKGPVGDNDRRKQIADESAELLNMALALKAEVDKTTKDTLSLNVIKKADEIEKLAKQVKEKMKKSGS